MNSIIHGIHSLYFVALYRLYHSHDLVLSNIRFEVQGLRIEKPEALKSLYRSHDLKTEKLIYVNCEHLYFIRRHDIAEILLKVALNTKNQSINLYFIHMAR
jgi:hypothetical protein